MVLMVVVIAIMTWYAVRGILLKVLCFVLDDQLVARYIWITVVRLMHNDIQTTICFRRCQQEIFYSRDITRTIYRQLLSVSDTTCLLNLNRPYNLMNVDCQNKKTKPL